MENQNLTAEKMANSFGKQLKEIIALEKTADKSIVNKFKKGDVLACFAGSPKNILCIVELHKDNPNVDNFNNFITDKSYLPLTSHLMSSRWFKIN